MHDFITSEVVEARKESVGELVGHVVGKIEKPRRFNAETFSFHSAILALQTSSTSCINPADLKPLVEKYSEAFHFKEREAELPMAKRYFEKQPATQDATMSSHCRLSTKLYSLSAKFSHWKSGFSS